MGLDRATILGLAKLRIIPVEVPEWNGTVYLREMTAGQRDQFDALQLASDESTRFQNIRARLLIMSLCDESGALLFTGADIPTVSGFPAGIVNRLWESCLDLNGMRPGAAEKN